MAYDLYRYSCLGACTYSLLGLQQTLLVPPPGYRGRWPGAGSGADQLVPLAGRQRLVRSDYLHFQRTDCKFGRFHGISTYSII